MPALEAGARDAKHWEQERDVMLQSDLTGRQVVRHVAAEMGVTVEELEAEYEKVAPYYR